MYSNLFVCLMGMGTVFVGLVCIVFLVKIMSAVCRSTERGKNTAPTAVPVAPVPAANSDKAALMAAIAAAIAADMGTDTANIRIHSIKRV